MEILETLEALGPQVSLVLKERGAPWGHRAQRAAMVDLEMPGHEDFLETLGEMEREVLLVPVHSVVTQE